MPHELAGRRRAYLAVERGRHLIRVCSPGALIFRVDVGEHFRRGRSRPIGERYGVLFKDRADGRYRGRIERPEGLNDGTDVIGDLPKEARVIAFGRASPRPTLEPTHYQFFGY